MIYLTLATAEERWEPGQIGHFLREEGSLFWVMCPVRGGFPTRVVLKQEVADWCWDNIGPYRIVDHAPNGKFGHEDDDSWRIEFKSDVDMAFFKMRWM